MGKGGWPKHQVVSRRMPTRCPMCTHRSRMHPVPDRDAYACRWGHAVTGLEVVGRWHNHTPLRGFDASWLPWVYR